MKQELCYGYCLLSWVDFNAKSSEFWCELWPKGGFLTSWEDILLEVILQFQLVIIHQLPITFPDCLDKLNSHFDECMVIVGRCRWRLNCHLGTLKVFSKLIGINCLLLPYIFDILLVIVFFRVLTMLLLMILTIYQYEGGDKIMGTKLTLM